MTGGASILLVDDDMLSQQLFRSILEAKGHRVDTAGDGFAAVERVLQHEYDLALVDYHLPEIDGYTLARLLGACARNEAKPKVVAITADRNGLSAQAGADALFDAILPKPIEPDTLARTIDQVLRDPRRERAREASRALWRERGLADRPRAVAVPVPTREQALALDLCFDLAPDPLTADLILLLEPGAADVLSAVRSRSPGGHLTPIIDMTGTLTAAADGVFRVNEGESWSAVATALRRFSNRCRALSGAIRTTSDFDTRLLAYLYVADRALEPARDVSQHTFLRYPGFFRNAEVTASAERLAERGLLTRRFVDRFHACSGCGSHRMNVREECPSCHSPNLAETTLLHHYRCAYHGPEEEFRSGVHLVCPKCRGQLRHYGSDYERSGTSLKCRACCRLCSEAAIGFLCMDCDHHMDGEVVSTRDIFAYDLSQRAMDVLAAPEAAPCPSSATSIPPEVHQVIENLRQHAPEALLHFAVAEIRYGARYRMTLGKREAAFAALRRLFVENLRNLLAEVGHVVSSQDADYLVLPSISANEVRGSALSLLAECEAVLAEPIAPELNLLPVERAAA